MKSTLIPRSILWTTLLMACGTQACGADSADPADSSHVGDGFTACGDATCQPGQYCFGPDTCVAGCTSDANCVDDTPCVDIDAGTHVGVCQNGANDPGEGEGEGEESSTCDSYADHTHACGLAASEATAIKLSCDQAAHDVRLAMIACDAAETCDELRSCSGVECFADADCGAGGDCLLRSDVVDPFADVPYTCR